MKLHEYQSKALFAQHGIPIPKGRVATSAREARDIAADLGGKVVIKSQVLVGGRGKAGGIKLARTESEAEELAAQVLSMTIKGLPVRKVLVDEIADIRQEIYLGLTHDRATRRPVLIASAGGGAEIEELARTDPDKIIRELINPLLGLKDYQARNVALAIDLPREHWSAFAKIAAALYQTYVDCDATLAEINPLVITADRRLLALDGKLVIDDNALFRQAALAEMRDPDEDAPREREARKYGLVYVQLEGNIGCLVNGAGLAMCTMDIIQHCGGQPANFLDIGGGAQADKVTAALRLILADPQVKAVLLNIFGGITRCDEVARGLIAAVDEVQPSVPIVARLVGTNENDGRRLLTEAHLAQLLSAQSLAEAAQTAVTAAANRLAAA